MKDTEDKTMRDKTVIYHGNCPDGFGAAFAAWMRFGDEADYVPAGYGKPPPETAEGGEVYVVDFSYPAATLAAMATRSRLLVVLDHHHTAQAALSGLSLPGADIRFDMGKSGAVMAWEYFHQGIAVPEFFLYLQDRDLWRFELPESREVSCALRSYPFDFKVWAEVTGLTTGIHELPGILVDQLKKEGVACLRLTRQQVENMARHHRWAVFDTALPRVSLCSPTSNPLHNPNFKARGWVAPAANATVFFSEVGERLLEMYPEAQFAAYYSDRSDGKRQWGLRSREGFDCSAVAKALGGGGHKQAAGFVEEAG